MASTALQSEEGSLRQQLLHTQDLRKIDAERIADKDEVFAAKESELAAKEGELQSLRLLAASQAQQLVRQADVVEGGGGEHVKKRARVADDGRSPLADDQILVPFSWHW
jgi:hypothetical protein